jgi:hypothetical protein
VTARVKMLATASAVALLAGGCAIFGPAPLVHLETHGAKVENGKTLDMRFDEIERTDDASIVEVTFGSGGSVSSSMFVMRGVCAVAAARHAGYVASHPLDTHGIRYRLTFFAREEDAPRHWIPHRDGRPDRTVPDALSSGLCTVVRLLTIGE